YGDQRVAPWKLYDRIARKAVSSTFACRLAAFPLLYIQNFILRGSADGSKQGTGFSGRGCLRPSGSICSDLNEIALQNGSEKDRRCTRGDPDVEHRGPAAPDRRPRCSAADPAPAQKNRYAGDSDPDQNKEIDLDGGLVYHNRFKDDQAGYPENGQDVV